MAIFARVVRKLVMQPKKRHLYLYIHNFIGALLSSIVKGALIKDCENVLKAQSHVKVIWSKLRTLKVD